MIHVAYLTDSLVSGGAQRQLVELARNLSHREGVRVSVVVYHDLDFFGDRLRQAGVPLTVLRKGGKLDLRLVPRLGAWIRTNKPDVLHAFQLHPAVWGLLALRMVQRAARPAYVAGQRSQLRDGFVERMLQALVFHGSDAITVNATDVMGEIAVRHPRVRTRTLYLPNGIDLEDWDERADRESPVPADREHFHFALIGGLRPAKNHRGLLEAISLVPPERRKKWRVWFVGDETSGGPFADGVRRQIVERGLSEIVRILPATSEVPALMRHLDALVLPSLEEGFPNVLLEAMASRLPCVATRVGEVPQLLGDGEAGFVVPPSDGAALALALERIEDMPEPERRAMGERARRAVETRFSLEAVASRHLALYQELARRKRPPDTRPLPSAHRERAAR